ncbi:MAG: Gfo/Idh/MocA family oxidoreductase [Candidatus Anammoximicrobium sp.]|nr:Gfo/Idh/MocA family oxidoreductase [Candidatus Anammoximicrobium sp.]
MFRQHRRDFLKRAATGGIAAAFAISGTKASGRVLGANDRVRIAVAGVNGRGQQHITAYGEMRDVEIAWLVDPDSRLFASRSAAVQKLAGNTPQCVQDFRRVLDDPTLDAVSLVTPNHWHALLAVWACQAGKDVLVEKPCSHNISEGRRIVEAARKYGRIVQHGTQRRSDPRFVKLTADVRSGKFGKLRLAFIKIHRPRETIGVRPAEQPPAELDYNLWVGPAPVHPYRSNLVPYDWHWIWDFGNGEIGNLGSHQLDVARWAMPAGAAPQRVVSLGGRFGYRDQGQTPNTQLTVFDCGDVKLMCAQRGLVDRKAVKVTVEFHTAEGVIREGRFFPHGQSEGEPIPGAPAGGFADLGRLHFRNFIDCIRSRRREELSAEILEGHRSTLLAHLGNLSYRLGEEVPFGKPPGSLGGDPLAGEAFEDLQRHLADAAGLDLGGATYRLGRTLRFDAQAERFVGDPDADQRLTRPYRSPFVVPEQV